MNLQQARANPHRSLFRHFTESAAYVLLFAVPAANAHSPHDTPEQKSETPPVGVVADANAAGNVALHIIRRQKADEAEPPQEVNESSAIVDFTTHPDGWDVLPQTIATKMLREIEKRANATNPKYPITIMDDDTINLRRTDNIPTFRNRMYEVLNDRKISLRWSVKSDIATALGGLKGPTHRDPQAFRIDPDSYKESRNPLDENVDQKHISVVITSVPDLSSRSFINKWIGHKSGPNIMEAKIDPGPYAMMLRTTWHEVWHGLDSHFLEEGYYIKGDPALDNALRMHKAEVFAEVAAVLTMAPEYPKIVQQMADIRAISSDYESRKTLPGIRPSDVGYYDGVSYYLTRALDLVEDHIRTVGMDAVSRYTMDDISRVARDITVRGALSKTELHHMATSLAAGAPVSARVRLAKERLMQDTGVPVPPKPTRAQRSQADEDHYFVDKILQDVPDAEKQQIKDAVKEAAAPAIARGQLGEDGLVALIESWRKKVQEEDPQARAYERKLYVLTLMLTQGHLDKDLGRETRAERAAKAEAAAQKAYEAAKKAAEIAAPVTLPKTDDVKIDDVKIDDVKIDDVKAGDVKADEVKAEEPKAEEKPETNNNSEATTPTEKPLEPEAQPAPLQALELVDIPAQVEAKTLDITQDAVKQNDAPVPVYLVPKAPVFKP